jgi:hypothetical protein
MSLPRTTLVTACVLLALAARARAGELRVVPGEVALAGPRARQSLRVLEYEEGRAVADHTARAVLRCSRPEVAAVDGAAVRAAGDGTATVTASVAGREAVARIRVSGTREPFVPSFRNHVIPLLTRVGCNAGACHGALAGKGGLKLSLRGYDPAADHFVLTRQALGRRVDRSDPARSLFLLKPTLAVPHGGGHKLDTGGPDYRLLADWVAAGAPGPRGDDPRIVRLEVFPAAARLRPGDAFGLVVRAGYSDGHAEDVTRWARYQGSEDLVAAVNPDGRVAAAGAGEAAVSVLFANRVATCRVTVPHPGPVDEKLFAAAPRVNFIDDFVLAKLRDLRIPPSPPCTDTEFIRRAYLDAAGILPTPDEVRRFLADAAPDKRARLVDALLERPEFVDCWAYRWSDLLLVTTRRLPQPAVWSFYRFVRESVADNKPWDRFAREILTATGSNLDNGAANYFVLHKDVSDRTESTAVTFLGTSVTCCRCHNHPLEKWTQDQYWSLANLFARVALKNGDRPGEVLVQDEPQGDVPHPRRGVAVPPAPLDAPPLPADSAVSRRRYLADWVTAPENPYFARALVNRVWRTFLGRGLVEAEDDLRQTNPPTNEELLGALAADFVRHRFDVKYLARTVMTSATYQRSSGPLPGSAADDRFYSHYLVRRLPAEVILDAYAQVTGVPTPFTEVASNARDAAAGYDGYPVGTRALQLPDALVVSPFLDAFGRPERSQTCSCERQQDSTVGQALHLNNGKTLNDKLRSPRSRVADWVRAGVSDGEAVRRLYLLALCREPTAAETAKFRALLAEAAADGKDSRRAALEDLFWAVLSSREFLFNR